MVPTPIRSSNARNLRILYPIANIAANFGPKVVTRVFNHDETHQSSALHKRAAEVQGGELIAFAILIPVLVLLSGLFAGLTLGYMSLDETQLHVLSISGTPKQKEYARKIQPIRKNGHLLLITLILANMIVNETLPVIADPVLGGGVPGVVVSTVLIVIFSEILPQSICTRYGLAIGAHMAWFVRILILVLGVVAWPVAKFLEFILGSHHGIMYRRAELKELIALHSSNQELGGDLKSDTVTIIGATLDLQEKVRSPTVPLNRCQCPDSDGLKVVRQAMTAIEKVFMLSIDDKLDYDTMKRIYDTGHSRVPVYEEIEVPVITESLQEGAQKDFPVRHKKVKKIVGVLLVKQVRLLLYSTRNLNSSEPALIDLHCQCLLLDPKEATPIRSLKLNPLPCVPMNEPLLSILDRFQTGRSHMAIVSRFSEEKAESVKKQVKKNFTRKLKDRVGIHSSSEESSDSASDGETEGSARTPEDDHPSDAPFDEKLRRKWRKRRKSRKRQKEKADLERGEGSTEQGVQQQVPSKDNVPKTSKLKDKLTSVGREQQMPDDAVLPKGGAKEVGISLVSYFGCQYL
ncbi:DUF21-domain-containing protein [Panus rudis PR-1116 ss-1]|nr:DUF21-domain-containing protein [Panus rudis PR-1116 ss-1]